MNRRSLHVWGGSQEGQVIVEYAIVAATLVATVAVIAGLIGSVGLREWLEAIKGALFVSAESPSDILEIGRELVDR